MQFLCKDKQIKQKREQNQDKQAQESLAAAISSKFQLQNSTLISNLIFNVKFNIKLQHKIKVQTSTSIVNFKPQLQISTSNFNIKF